MHLDSQLVAPRAAYLTYTTILDTLHRVSLAIFKSGRVEFVYIRHNIDVFR